MNFKKEVGGLVRNFRPVIFKSWVPLSLDVSSAMLWLHYLYLIFLKVLSMQYYELVKGSRKPHFFVFC